MSMTASASRLPEFVDRVAAVVVMVARGLAWASFGSAVVIGIAILLEMEERPLHWMLTLTALVLVLSLPGWVLLGFRGALGAAREIPGAVLAWPQTARVAHGRFRSADGGLASGTAAARAAWKGGRELGLVKAGLAVTRLSFVLAALLCAVIAPIEVILAITVVTATVVL